MVDGFADASAEHNSWTAGWKVGLRAGRWLCHRNLNGDISIRTRRRGVVRGSVKHKRATAPHPACPPLRQRGTITQDPGHARRGDREYSARRQSVYQLRASSDCHSAKITWIRGVEQRSLILELEFLIFEIRIGEYLNVPLSRSFCFVIFDDIYPFPLRHYISHMRSNLFNLSI